MQNKVSWYACASSKERAQPGFQVKVSPFPLTRNANFAFASENLRKENLVELLKAEKWSKGAGELSHTPAVSD